MTNQSTTPTGQTSVSEPVFLRTNSHTEKVSAYPAQCIPADLARFLFSTPKNIHLYECYAHPMGIGVIR